MRDRLLRAIRQSRLIAPGDRVLVAVSGGADSVALAWLLADAARAEPDRWIVAGLVHVHHGLRGAEADRDEAFVRALAARLGVPVEVARPDVAGLARSRRVSIEAAARAARDGSFADAARRLRASHVATAHTRDDQAETVLMRLLRGSSARGLSGIRPRRGQLIRPLLACGRAELRAYLTDRGETWCEDSTNADRGITRNAVRHALLPVIAGLAPAGIAAIARFAALAAADETYLNGQATEVGHSLVLKKETGVEIDRRALAAVPEALGRRIIRAALEHVSPAAVTARHIAAVGRAASGRRPAGRLTLPRVVADWTPGWITLSPARVAEPAAPFACLLSVPGRVDLPLAGVAIEATRSEVTGIGPAMSMSGRGEIAAVQADRVALPFTVRSRQPGDRLRPLGAPGRRKVQDLFVDHKLPRALRDAVPIVVDAEGRIVWVVGHALAEECRVTDPSAGMVLLKVDRFARDESGRTPRLVP